MKLSRHHNNRRRTYCFLIKRNTVRWRMWWQMQRLLGPIASGFLNGACHRLHQFSSVLTSAHQFCSHCVHPGCRCRFSCEFALDFIRFYRISFEFICSIIEIHCESTANPERIHGDSQGFTRNPKLEKLSPDKRCKSIISQLQVSRANPAVQPPAITSMQSVRSALTQ